MLIPLKLKYEYQAAIVCLSKGEECVVSNHLFVPQCGHLGGASAYSALIQKG